VAEAASACTHLAPPGTVKSIRAFGKKLFVADDASFSGSDGAVLGGWCMVPRGRSLLFVLLDFVQPLFESDLFNTLPIGFTQSIDVGAVASQSLPLRHGIFSTVHFSNEERGIKLGRTL